jgi:hypothetical protein
VHAHGAVVFAVMKVQVQWANMRVLFRKKYGRRHSMPDKKMDAEMQAFAQDVLTSVQQAQRG